MKNKPQEPVEAIAREAIAENPDETTRRETFELDLQERDRSEDGSKVDLTDVDRGTERLD